MDQTDLSRRRALQLSSVAGITALAGCTGILDDSGGDGDLPGYATYLAPDENDETAVAYLDIEGIQEAQDGFGDGGNATDDFPEDPLLSLPVGGLVILAFAQFGLSTTGLDALVESLGGNGGEQNESDDGQEFTTEITEEVLANGAIVLTGDVDTGEVDEILGTAPEDDFFAQEFEQVDTVGDYSVYQPVGGGEDNTTGGGAGGSDGIQTVAVSGDDIISGSPREQVDRAIEAVQGDRERSTEQFDEFEWLLETAGNGHVAYGGHGPEGFDDAINESEETDGGNSNTSITPDIEEVGEANGVVSSLTFESDMFEANLAAIFDEDISEDVQSEIEAQFGSESTDLSTEFDGNRLTVSGSYDPDAL